MGNIFRMVSASIYVLIFYKLCGLYPLVEFLLSYGRFNFFETIRKQFANMDNLYYNGTCCWIPIIG